MGSQTLEILRQGVWASLTGGWFYDPHQGVFCNVVHLYLWLFLLCSPFVTYLYFPATLLTWSIYCVLTSLTILGVKLANMALHRLYDRAQTMSESNLKNPFFKITKDCDVRDVDDDDVGIEMQVLGNDLPSRNSVEQAINEASEENSLLSMENVNSIIDLKVDVHRKNSSESIEFMFYAHSMLSANSQQDQNSLTGCTGSVNKSLRSAATAITNTSAQSGGGANIDSTTAKYLSVYPEHMGELSPTSTNTSANTNKSNNASTSTRQAYLQRMPSEDYKRHPQQRRRLERQNSLDAAAESALINKLARNQSDTFLQQHHQLHSAAFGRTLAASKATAPSPSATTTTSTKSTTSTAASAQQLQRLSTPYTAASSTTASTTITTATTNSPKTHSSSVSSNSAPHHTTKTARLQRHRSSETHDERVRQQQRGLFLPIHHEQHHVSSGAGSSGAFAQIRDDDELELGLGGSAGIVPDIIEGRGRSHGLQSWVLGSSSDMYLEDDSFTKSDLGIEQLDKRSAAVSAAGTPKSRSAVILQQQNLNSHYHHHHHHHHHQQQHHHHQQHHHQQYRPHGIIRKDSNSTMSALQLPVAPPPTASVKNGAHIKRRRHSNATSLFKSSNSASNAVNAGTSNAALTSGSTNARHHQQQQQQQPTVRRIKSTALEISCPRPSVSNLTPHPNSVEAINGQQIKNPQSALLPPPSKCLVRNPHLNLCPKFGGSFGSSSCSGSSLNFGGAGGGSTTALFEQPIVEHTDERASLDLEQHLRRDSSEELQIEDLDAEAADDVEQQQQPECELDTDLVAAHVDDIETIAHHVDDCQQHALCRQHADCASGVCQLPRDDESDDAEGDEDEADDDAFKDFDDNLEHMLQVLQLTEEKLQRSTTETSAEAAATLAAVIAATSAATATAASTTAAALRTDSIDSDAEEDEEEDEQQQQHLHSTDSETDNNGSRSPLLSGRTRNQIINAADKSLMHEIAAAQQKKQSPQQQALSALQTGCSSSDFEQLSASSKDQLLSGSGSDSKRGNTTPTAAKSGTKAMASNKSAVEDIESSTVVSCGKSLGAIPKLLKYREVDERAHKAESQQQQQQQPTLQQAQQQLQQSQQQLQQSMQLIQQSQQQFQQSHQQLQQLQQQLLQPMLQQQSQQQPTPQQQQQLFGSAHSAQHKRRANAQATSCAVALPSSNSGNSKNASRNSSTNSSRSFSADSFSADFHKMLWLMSGGNVDDSGRPHTLAAAAAAAAATSASTSSAAAAAAAAAAEEGGVATTNNALLPASMSMAHYQFYQDALNALHTQPNGSSNNNNNTNGNAADGALLLSERMLLRERLRRSSKQMSEPLHSTTSADFHELHGALSLTQALATLGGVNSTSKTAADPTMSGTRSASDAPLIIQELVQGLNEGRHGGGGVGGITQQRLSNSAAASAAPILNVDGHQLESYCEYWRPACLLSAAGAAEKSMAPKSFYKYRFACLGYERELKISMDRLELLALFDRDLHWLHILLAVLLAALVSYLGATILQLGFYSDLLAFLFCAVIAGAQYSLVKSVQPDAASPIHGFNKTVAYSRAIYFSVCGGLLLALQQLRLDYADVEPVPSIAFFGLTFEPLALVTSLLHVMCVLLLCFPLIFSLGLFPQINTFLLYLLEQIDMHVFGGNAAGSLLGSFLCVLRSILGVLLLYGPLYAALAEGRGTQYIVFSLFCAMLIPLGYHLSRSASDFSHLWALIKNSIVSTYREDDDELSAATSSGSSSQKLTTSTPKRAKSELTADTPGDGGGEQIEMSSMEKLPSQEQEAAAASTTTRERTRSKSKAHSLASSSSSQTLGRTMSSSKKAGGGGGTNSNSLASVVDEADADAAPATTVDDAEAPQMSEDKLSTTSTTNPADISTLTAGGAATNNQNNPHNNTMSNALETDDSESPDPLPKKLQNTVNTRLKNDFVVTTILAVVVFGLHCSTVFTVLQPDLNIVLYAFTGALGLLLHYIIPQLRKHMPWLCFARPLLRQQEFGQFEVTDAAKVMWFEKVYIYLCMLERNVLFPLLVISALTADAQIIANKFGIAWGTLIVATCAMKFIRNAYSDPTNQYLIVMFTVLFFRVDFAFASETFLIDYFFIALAFRKCCDFLLKLQFIVTYIAPWQITWGSAFHAFAQPFSVPHSAMLFLQAGVSALLSTPLNPFLGSAIFLTSYVRPIKFWERDYNTRRIDHSNTRLSSQLERDLGADDNNLNSIFYEHLTRSLQHSLCGDLLLGRWGNVNQGDCFVLASDYLNCLVHIIELGNGLCTFQMRGLEFRGTYCQQREVEAITEDVEDNDGCCCCDPGHLPRMLSANAMFSTRWLAWQVVAAQYVLEGYSISDNLASATLQVFEYRKVLITYYIKSIIYYVLKNPKLDKWLASGPIQEALHHTLSRQFVELDPIFNYNLDEDFDCRAMGITRTSFWFVYHNWIQYCSDMRQSGQTSPTQHNVVPAPPHNDSVTTTIMRNNALSSSHGQSQSQQQLRARHNRGNSNSNNVTNTAASASDATITDAYSKMLHSTEHMATSQSFVSISRQNSESAPGLAGAGAGSSSGVSKMPPKMYQRPEASDASLEHSAAKSPPATTASAPPPPPTTTAAADGVSLNDYTNFITTPLPKMYQVDDLTRGDGAGISTHIPLHGSLENSSATVGGYTRITKPPPRPPKVYKSTSAAASSPTTNAEQTARPPPNAPRSTPAIAKDSSIVSLCLALGLLARRSLATASHSSLTGVEFFLHGLHALFKGDFRITSPRDEWVFADMELLHAVVAPAVKMALKLQQDHISNPDEFLEPEALYTAISSYSKELVISHEADPVWRSAVLRGAPNLLALRHVMEDGADEYRIIRLTKRFLNFRVIKLNRECVRGLWAGQQQELIYLRNRNPERGSIQNAKQALRNIINSSCDQPIGYPIYVSPLTTSYADTNVQLCQVVGGALTPEAIKSHVLQWWQRVRERCRQGCSSGSTLENSQLGGVIVGGVGSAGGGGGNIGGGGGDTGETAPVYISAPLYNTLTVGNFFGLRSASNTVGINGAAAGIVGGGINGSTSLSTQYGSQSLAGVASTRSALSALNKPTSTTLLAGLLNRERDLERESARDLAREPAPPREHRLMRNTRVIMGTARVRRATLPITSDGLSGAGVGGAINESTASTSHMATTNNESQTPTTSTRQMNRQRNRNRHNRRNTTSLEDDEADDVDDNDDEHNSNEQLSESSARYEKMFCSASNLGIGNIITTPGEYPRKAKGPICFTAATAACEQAKSLNDAVEGVRKTLIELFKKVIIVDGTEIYDCLDLGRRIDVVWPNERMRMSGGRLSWKDWTPRVGMVGHVVHYWMPNHWDQRFRSHVNRTLYLIEIGDHYVPVGEFGVREYNQIVDTRERSISGTSLRSSVQREYDERMREREREREGLTPILGSSLESPTFATTSTFSETFAGESGVRGGCVVPTKINAVSSSSSEDEELSNLERRLEMHRRDIINRMKLMTEKKTKEETKDEAKAVEWQVTDEQEGVEEAESDEATANAVQENEQDNNVEQNATKSVTEEKNVDSNMPDSNERKELSRSSDEVELEVNMVEVRKDELDVRKEAVEVRRDIYNAEQEDVTEEEQNIVTEKDVVNMAKHLKVATLSDDKVKNEIMKGDVVIDEVVKDDEVKEEVVMEEVVKAVSDVKVTDDVVKEEIDANRKVKSEVVVIDDVVNDEIVKDDIVKDEVVKDEKKKSDKLKSEVLKKSTVKKEHLILTKDDVLNEEEAAHTTSPIDENAVNDDDENEDSHNENDDLKKNSQLDSSDV